MGDWPSTDHKRIVQPEGPKVVCVQCMAQVPRGNAYPIAASIERDETGSITAAEYICAGCRWGL